MPRRPPPPLEGGAAPRPAPGPHLALPFVFVYLVLLLLLPSQLVFLPLGSPGKPATLWSIAGLVWWCCLSVGGLARKGRVTPIRIALGLLAVAVLASYADGMVSGWYAPPTTRQITDELWTLVPPTVDQITAVSISAADRGLLSMAGWLGVTLIAAEGMRSWRDLDLVISWLSWLGAVVAAVAVVQFTTGVDLVRYITVPGLSLNTELGGVLQRSVLRRVSSTAIHPIEFGVTMACLLPLALHRAIFRWGSRGALVPVGLIFLGAALSVSRSAILALAVSGLILLLGWPPAWRLRALFLLPAAVVGLRVAVPGLVGTIYSLFYNLGNDPSIDGRTSDYAVVFDLFGDHPWLGRGLYTFVPRNYRILDNQWLMVMLELGLVGLVAVLVLLLTGYFCARSTFRHATTPASRHLGLAIASSIAGAAVSMATYDAWGFPMHTGLCFLLIGLAGASWRLARHDRLTEVASPPLGTNDAEDRAGPIANLA